MCLFESTMFKQVLYHPDESQVLTTGSNRKITYWDCFDGQAIRMLDGSETGEIDALAITENGEHFVSGGQDKKVKLWDYDEGICYYNGIGHSGDITKIQISPDQRTLVSVGTEGAIFMWHMPEAVLMGKKDQDQAWVTNTWDLYKIDLIDKLVEKWVIRKASKNFVIFPHNIDFDSIKHLIFINKFYFESFKKC